jgi:hypothetical protein
MVADWGFGIQEDNLQKTVTEARAKGAQVVVLAGSRSQPVNEEQARPAIEQYLLTDAGWRSLGATRALDAEVEAMRVTLAQTTTALPKAILRTQRRSRSRRIRAVPTTRCSSMATSASASHTCCRPSATRSRSGTRKLASST